MGIRNIVQARDFRSMRENQISHHEFHDLRRLPDVAADAIIAILVIKNEALRLPAFLDHHRKLGVDRFVIIDNCSNDDGVAFLLNQPDVEIIQTSNSYREAMSGTCWAEVVRQRYGFDRWYLYVDADELLVYDGSDRRNLRELAEHMRRWGCKALYAPMIDLYSDKPFGQIGYQAGKRLQEACRYFDGSSYRKIEKSLSGKWYLSGGPRIRLLSNDRTEFFHSIAKYPFFYWDRSVHRRSIHNFTANGQKEQVSGALLHFKFLDDFKAKIDEAIESKEHWLASSQYSAYGKAMESGDLTNLMYEDSLEYIDMHSLIHAGLTEAIHWNLPKPTRLRFWAWASGRPWLKSVRRFAYGPMEPSRPTSPA